MRRLLLASLAVTMAAAAPAAADDSEDLAEQIDEPDYDEPDYEEEEYEEEYCGGGEETLYDVAYTMFDAGQYAGVRRVLVDALQAHEVDAYERPAYLVLLGQTQLRLGELRHAAVNFRRAVDAAPDQANQNGARIGLAVALARRGNRRRAIAEARRFVDDACADGRGLTRCYVANVVIATAGRDEATRNAGREQARRTHGALRDYELGAVAYYEQLFDVASWPTDSASNESA